MKSVLDKMFKDTGHVNAYFPLFIQNPFLLRAKHVDGFAKECAVVTHYRLKNNDSGEIVVDEDAKLEEELIVLHIRNNNMGYLQKRWIKSYRDLPLINQWANVVRWGNENKIIFKNF